MELFSQGMSKTFVTACYEHRLPFNGQGAASPHRPERRQEEEAVKEAAQPPPAAARQQPGGSAQRQQPGGAPHGRSPWRPQPIAAARPGPSPGPPPGHRHRHSLIQTAAAPRSPPPAPDLRKNCLVGRVS